MQCAALSTIELAYTDRGTGPPVLLVHGFPLDHTMWSSQIDALAERWRVIAPDLRGFGQSPLGNADPQAGISMERYADDLAELLDALGIGEPVVLAGFSMGVAHGQAERPKQGRFACGVEADDDEWCDETPCAHVTMPGGQEVEPLIGACKDMAAFEAAPEWLGGGHLGRTARPERPCWRASAGRAPLARGWLDN